jgi:hypothetical protein
VVFPRIAAQEGEGGIAEPARIGDDKAEAVAIERDHRRHIGDEQADMAEAQRDWHVAHRRISRLAP